MACDGDDARAILDEAPHVHIGFHSDDGPAVIPTPHARDGDQLSLHGSSQGAGGIRRSATRPVPGPAGCRPAPPPAPHPKAPAPHWPAPRPAPRSRTSSLRRLPGPLPPAGPAAFHERVVNVVRAGAAAEVPDTSS
ncbi:pyridoxamine 5'-phosphate oxidase family protein [Streptomyces sp. NBC_00435]|uniref:pyridoxamine 5'-phosphate oxidase family protein n=1 Tax=Streptomyces sp. NBC_00435 TaxID=2903649 RepID=UPI003FA7D0B3